MGTLLLVAVLGLGWFFRSVLVTAPDLGQPDAPAAEPAVKAKPDQARQATAPATGEHERFEFYDMLPEAQVDVNVPPPARPATTPPPVSVPGIYVIQAGAYPNYAEADKVKARLALLGIVAAIQKVENKGAVFHRVRIGPINDLRELNRVRGRLRDSRIEYLVIPVSD